MLRQDPGTRKNGLANEVVASVDVVDVAEGVPLKTGMTPLRKRVPVTQEHRQTMMISCLETNPRTSSACRVDRPTTTMMLMMSMTMSTVALRMTKKKSHVREPEADVADVGDGAEVANLRLWKKHRMSQTTMNRTMMMTT